MGRDGRGGGRGGRVGVEEEEEDEDIVCNPKRVEKGLGWIDRSMGDVTDSN